MAAACGTSTGIRRAPPRSSAWHACSNALRTPGSRRAVKYPPSTPIRRASIRPGTPTLTAVPVSAAYTSAASATVRASGRQAVLIDQVLERHRDAVQRPFVLAAREFGIGIGGGRERLVTRDGDEGVQRGIERVDAGQARARELPRRELSAPEQSPRA